MSPLRGRTCLITYSPILDSFKFNVYESSKGKLESWAIKIDLQLFVKLPWEANGFADSLAKSGVCRDSLFSTWL
ncbi:hypothetical protein GOBAR_DD36435 [Gossypium barbadense]|nr:hypothetical protein GOBAR_DD36435 [Gossypium barbadense]